MPEADINESDDMSLAVGLEVVRKAGVTQVVFDYYWENDQGELRSVHFLDKDGNYADHLVPDKLWSKVEAWFFDNHSGQYGELTVDLVAGTVLERGYRRLGEE